MYKSLRDFVESLEHNGELLRVSTEVSTEYEITEIVDRVSKSPDGGKALLFENCGTQFPLLINMMGSERRMAMVAGVERLEELTERIDNLLRGATSPMDSIWDKLKMLPLLGEVSAWMPRKLSSRGACQEVQLLGDKACLSLLPILKCWGFDGGRFITLPMVNTIDPDTGGRNVGMYRMQVIDDHTTGMHWHIHKTGARHYDAYKRRGERMAVSVALGGDPAYTYAATAPMPDNMDEYLLAGFMRQKSVKLVKCITNDIYVPEDCDFVIEGYVDPAEEKIVEGPFGDHTGFYSLQDMYPLFHVTAITHRKDAIYPATIVGIPPQEDAAIAVASERIFVAPIRFALHPEVRDLYMPSAGTAHNLVLTSIKSRYAGQAQKIILSMWGSGQMMFNKYLMVADDDVDLRCPSQISSLMRNVDLRGRVLRGRGVLDVLDHATSTCGMGGKLALDLTLVESRVSCAKWREVAGYTLDDRLVEQWGLLLVFASPLKEIDLRAFLSDLEVEGVNFVALFDPTAAGLTPYDLLWLGAANTEVDRDVVQSESGSTLLFDARSKVPGRGANPKRFPNVVVSRPDIIERVDARWEEYQIGEFLESPSKKYSVLELSDKEDW
ncbi:MAG: menaquinone biosynthesis decarboxylase [Rikenellaceae bacterium]